MVDERHDIRAGRQRRAECARSDGFPEVLDLCRRIEDRGVAFEASTTGRAHLYGGPVFKIAHHQLAGMMPSMRAIAAGRAIATSARSHSTKPTWPLAPYNSCKTEMTNSVFIPT